MKQLILFTAILACYSISLHGQLLHYGIDDAHSHVKFTGLLGEMMEVEGKFEKFWGDVFFDPAHPEQLSVTLLIDPASLDTDNEWRDKHLANEEFLHTDSFPIIRFQSTGISQVDQSMKGNLLLKGETRPIEIQYQKTFGPGDDPWQNRRISFSGEFVFSRYEFGLGPTEKFWGGSIAEQATISFTISATRQNMDRMSIFQLEPMKSVWDMFDNQGTEKGLEALEGWKNNPPDERSTLRPGFVDRLAKRLRQREMAYLPLLEKNVKYFPEVDWVYANLALGYYEQGKRKASQDAAQKALELNSQNTLAMELLKE